MIEVLFADRHVIAVNKPSGMLSQVTENEIESVETSVKEWIREKEGKENPFVHAVHRLDRPVSGILLLARTSKALSRLQQSLRDNLTKKSYIALIEGRLPANEGVLEHFLRHGDHKAEVVNESRGALKAVLYYRLVKKGVVEVELKTGRYHQIRAQLSAVGCPIVGDKRYGSKQPWKNGIALHHTKMSFPHPISQVECFVNAPVLWLGSVS